METKFAKFNMPLLILTSLILVIGLINLYSAVYYWGDKGQSPIFWSQIIWVVIGFVFMFIAAILDYRFLHRFAVHIYVIINILLIVSLLFGKVVKGTSGWINIGGFSFQPSEFAKLAVVVILAKFYSENPNPDGFNLRDMLHPAFLMLVPFVFVLLQGDMGSSLFFILVFVSLAVFVKIQTKSLIFLIVVLLISAGLAYQFGLKDYQRSRILNFLNPEHDIKGSGYHLVQSKIAVGSGKFFGKGYLKGNINKLRYLPERHTDFIFPVFAEEWGFLGCSFILSLYISLLLLGVEIARRARDRFGILLALGIISLLFWQVAINLGGVLGLMPLTGVTLPLMSYGGSSMISVLASIGILQSISRRRFLF